MTALALEQGISFTLYHLYLFVVMVASSSLIIY